MYKAVLFDVDGTLLDTLEDLADSMNEALRRLGHPTHPIEPYRYYVGDGVETLARRALPPTARDSETVAKCVALMREEYGKRWANKTAPYDGIPDLLDALTARRVPMAVLSNKPDEMTKLIVARLLRRWRFALVVGARPRVPKKPDPTVAVEIARGLGHPPWEVVYLGDTNTDMQTACAAGMYAVGALWGFRTAEELRASGARMLIKKPMELLTLFETDP